MAAATPGAAHADPGGNGVDVVELARGELVVDAPRGLGFERLREGTLRALVHTLLGTLGEYGRRGNRLVRDGRGRGGRRPGRTLTQRLGERAAGLRGRVESLGHGRGGAHVDGADLGDGFGDGAACGVGRHGGHDGGGAAVGRLRGRGLRRGRNTFARGDVGGVVGVAGDTLGEGAARPTRQGRGLGPTVTAGRVRGVRGCRRSRGDRSSGDRGFGGFGRHELSGNALVARRILERGLLGADRRGHLVLLVGDNGGRGDSVGLVDGGLDDGHFVGTAATEEKGTQLHGGLLGEDSADHLGRVGHAGVAQDVAQGASGTCLRVPRAEDNAVDAGGENGTRAHRARFEGDDERAARQTPGSPGATSLTQRDNFGVTSGIVVRLAAVPPAADDPAVFVDDDGPDGDISRLAGAVGQEKGLPHCFAVLLIHGHTTSLPAKSVLG